tara:strand:+ start:503 stop:1066 length:564 start_codon:yes stop_codon:yes gene_type:complete
MSEGLVTPHSTIKQVLDDFGNEMQTDLRAELVKDKAYVSGNLAEQIDFSSIINGKGYVFTLRLKDYYDYVNKGVNGTRTVKNNTPYSYMQSSKIPFYFAKQWMNDKGLYKAKGTTLTSLAGKQYKAGSKDSQAFAMARSWKEKGTKGNHFYDNVVTEKRLDKLRKDLASAAAGDMKTVLTDSFKRLK